MSQPALAKHLKVLVEAGVLASERRGTWTYYYEQVNAYLDVARDNGFDGVLTISNQITAASTESPVPVDGRKLKRTALWHFSWWRVLTEAIVQHRYRGVSDPDQAWILGDTGRQGEGPAALRLAPSDLFQAGPVR